MIKDLHHIISRHQLILEPKDPFVVTVGDASQGLLLAKDLLYALCDRKTALFLSGGRTPKEFYQTVTKEGKLSVGAVGLVDERYGDSMHEDSNEKMIQDTGLLTFLEQQQTPFYPILKNASNSVIASEAKQSHDKEIATSSLTPRNDISIKDTALQYDETLRFLFNGFQKSVGILGIGLDGHTAGIPINTSLENKDQSLVTYFTDFPGPQKERISMTFLGLSMLDIMLVLVFGKDKEHALRAMFSEGIEEEIPARFFKRPDIAQKTLIITDQNV